MGNEEVVEKPPKKNIAEPEYESHCRMCKPTVSWRTVAAGNYVVYDVGLYLETFTSQYSSVLLIPRFSNIARSFAVPLHLD